MRVVIDARPALDPKRTGVGHYTENLLRYLPAADPETHYVAWHAGVRRGRSFRHVAPNLSEQVLRLPPELYRIVSWNLGVPRLEWIAAEFDLVIGTNFLPPATARTDRAVLVVHDLAFDRFPETAPHVDARWRGRFARALRACAAVVVPSESTRTDLLNAFSIEPGRVNVVRHGVDVEAFAPLPSDAVDAARARFGIRGPYALFIGGIETRKNLDTLVRAFSMVEGAPALVIAGGPVRWDPGAADRLDSAIGALPAGTRERILRPGYVDEEARRALLSGATMLALPSLHEGFGFPVLEAFAAGVPVLTSNSSSLPEVAGDAALLVDPHDAESIGKGLSQLFDDDDLRAMLQAAGLARVSGFTWESTARATADLLHAALERLKSAS